MDTPLLVGISGVKRSGKNTAAWSIADWAVSVGLTSFDRGFADKVKWAFARQFYPDMNMITAISWCDRFKEQGHVEIYDDPDTQIHFDEVSGRDCLAHLGTEVGRDIFGYDFWVDQLLPMQFFDAKSDWRGQEFNDADICTISDLRFDNELARVKYLNGFLIKIRNQEAERAVIEEANAMGREIHRSELGLADELFDVVINNDSTIDELNLRIRHVMNEVYKP